MGVFYAKETPAFIEDIHIDHEEWELEGFSWNYIERRYFDGALTCFVAMACYMFTFTLSVIMFLVNRLIK